MRGSVYKIQCKTDECSKFYIGASQNFNKRKLEHISRCSKVGGWKYESELYKTIRDNGGFNNWDFELLAEFEITANNKETGRKDLRRLESNHISKFINNINCMNQRL